MPPGPAPRAAGCCAPMIVGAPGRWLRASRRRSFAWRAREPRNDRAADCFRMRLPQSAICNLQLGTCMSGYSGTALAKKLGIKAGSHLLLVGAPDQYVALL